MSIHIYENWELFGRFVCSYRKLCGDGELTDFVKCWNFGKWEVLDKEWPEWKKFVEENK